MRGQPRESPKDLFFEISNLKLGSIGSCNKREPPPVLHSRRPIALRLRLSAITYRPPAPWMSSRTNARDLSPRDSAKPCKSPKDLSSELSNLKSGSIGSCNKRERPPVLHSRRPIALRLRPCAITYRPPAPRMSSRTNVRDLSLHARPSPQPPTRRIFHLRHSRNHLMSASTPDVIPNECEGSQPPCAATPAATDTPGFLASVRNDHGELLGKRQTVESRFVAERKSSVSRWYPVASTQVMSYPEAAVSQHRGNACE